MIKKNLLIAGAMLLILTAFSVNKAQAQTCVMPPSCEDLGYTMSSTDCASAEKILKCPHDQSKMFCLTMAEIDPGSSGNAGDILYEDHTTRADYVYMVDNRAIGVVFDPVNRLAIALDEISAKWGQGSVYNYNGGGEDTLFQLWDKGIPNLQKCGANPLTCGKAGKENTAIIVAYEATLYAFSEKNKNQIFYPAASYCYKYQPGSVSAVKSWFAAGQWFLPNVAELNILYQNKDKVNVALQKLNRSALQSRPYWASTEQSDSNAWYLDMASGQMDYKYNQYTHKDSKITDRYVRPVLAF